LNVPNHYKLMELFCGPGGLAVAAIKAKSIIGGKPFYIEPVWANDVDHDSCRTYALNIKNAPLEEVSDSVVSDDIRDIADRFSGIEFNSLAFGFPCNDFSMVGETKGFDGQYGPLYTYGVRALNARNPYWFLAENVGGLRNANEGRAFKTILADLENSGKYGYRLTAHLYRFEEYGVPQSRHRIIIVGIRSDLRKRFSVPVPLTTEKKGQVACRKAIEVPPIPNNASNHERTKQSQAVVERLMCLPPGENAWFLDKVLTFNDDELKTTMLGIQTFRKQFPKVVSPRQIRAVISRLKLNVKAARMSHIYKRLNPKLPSYTITGSGGGGTHVYHWKEPRALTNRERARLQTFSDDFLFVGSKESVRKQIGMAVPPEGAKHIFRSVLYTMGGKRYDSVQANLYETGADAVLVDTVLNDRE